MSTEPAPKTYDIPIANVTGIVLIWYVITVVVSRTITMIISPGIGVASGFYHYHHLLYGLILMSLGGFFGLYWETKRAKLVGSWFLGLGLGLAIDEVGLVLLAGTSIDGYFDPISYPIMILVAQILFIAYMAARQQGR
ncbi:MAG: hypothetical protein ACFFDP_12285 [Promethearchaeota archaeon]